MLSLQLWSSNCLQGSVPSDAAAACHCQCCHLGSYSCSGSCIALISFAVVVVNQSNSYCTALNSLCCLAHVLTVAKLLQLQQVAISFIPVDIAFRLVGKKMALAGQKVAPCSLHSVLCLARPAEFRCRQFLPAAALFSTQPVPVLLPLEAGPHRR